MYHLRDGFSFQRHLNGDVTVHVTIPPLNGAAPVSDEVVAVRQITVPAAEWASTVASMRAGGETADSHKRALDFHQGAPL